MNLAARIQKTVTQIDLPVIDVTSFLKKNNNWQKDCQYVAQSLKKFGLILIKDPRINPGDNDRFLDLMEKYFSKRSKQFDEGQTTLDFSPETNFRRGIMHSFQQKFQSYQKQKQALRPQYRALTPSKPTRDPKWRYLWLINAKDNIIAPDFPQFQHTMHNWGTHMINGCTTIAEMAAIGFDLQPNFFSRTLDNGEVMLAPTATDLQKTKVGDVLAAFHRDFDLLTIHGKARYGGLFAWLNTGEKFQVKVPVGHLLLQAGKQLEWLTGGQIKAGFHEVIHTQQVQKSKLEAIRQNRIPWRISSTMFCHTSNKVLLQPHKKFQTQAVLQKYPPIMAEDYLNQQLYYLTEVK